MKIQKMMIHEIIVYFNIELKFYVSKC